MFLGDYGVPISLFLNRRNVIFPNAFVNISETLRAHFTGYIVVLAANKDEEAQILTIESGVDDYLVRLFSFDLLEVRLRALTRRANHQ